MTSNLDNLATLYILIVILSNKGAGGEMANTLALGASAARLEGSSPSLPTIVKKADLLGLFVGYPILTKTYKYINMRKVGGKR